MPAARIVGPDGQPIARADLSRPIAPPRLTGARPVWRDALAPGLTPARLRALLTAAVDGDAHAYLTLAEEMEERSPHYAAVLGVRKRAVLGLARKVEAASDDPAAVALADAVRAQLVTRPGFGGALAALLDALGKGYSAVEIGWQTDRTPWTPAAYTWRDPRYFRYDRADGVTLRLLDDTNPVDGLPLPPYRFLVHTPRLKLGLPIRGGLARLAAVAVLCGHIVLEDWLSFAEVFGMPLRLGRYGDTAKAEDLATLRAAVEGLGANAAGLLHDSMRIEFQSATPGAGGSDLYLRLAEHLNTLISKAVLGRSDAADATPGRLGGETQASEVRRDILESDAEELQNTVNAQLVRPFIDLNFGPQEAYPEFRFHLPETEDLTLLVTALEKLVPLGLKVEQSVIRDKFNLPDPDEGAELLGAPPVQPPTDTSPPALNRAVNQIPPNPPFSKGGGEAIPPNPPLKKGGGEAGGIPDPTAPLVERLGEDADPLLNTLLDPVRAALQDSADLTAFREKLLTLYPDLDPSAFAALMAQALAVADAAGRFEAARHA